MWFLPLCLYLSAAVFLAGMGWRLVSWLRAPVPLKIVLTPGPATGSGVMRRLAGELFLFGSLFKAERSLWGAAWLFHLSLVLLAVGHIGGLVMPGLARASLGLSEEQFRHLAHLSGGAIGVVAIVPLAILLFRRLALERVRFISGPGDFFALALLLFVVVSGMRMRFMADFELTQARDFVAGVLSLRPVAAPTGAAFAAHVLSVCVLLVCFPFSKLVHVGGLFLSPTLNQKNNPRECRHVNPWDTSPV